MLQKKKKKKKHSLIVVFTVMISSQSPGESNQSFGYNNKMDNVDVQMYLKNTTKS